MSPELKTKIVVVDCLTDTIRSDYDISPTNAVSIAPRHMIVAPGEAGEIVKRIAMHGPLVEAGELLCESLRAQRSGTTPTPISAAVGARMRALEALLARCKEVPK